MRASLFSVRLVWVQIRIRCGNLSAGCATFEKEKLDKKKALSLFSGTATGNDVVSPCYMASVTEKTPC